MTLQSQYHGNTNIKLQSKQESSYFDIPDGKSVVYNDNTYYFLISDTFILPSKVIINDDIYDVEFCEKIENQLKFKLKDCDKNKPFLESFGAIKIILEISGNRYYSKSINVLVSNTSINQGILNMIQYIYDNCENYLYEEHEHSSVSTGIKKSETISLEAKIAFFQNTLNIYKQSYQYLKINPYSKLEKTESVGSFDKLQTVSQRTIQYIINHIDELSNVSYDTGIQFNNQYYQPNRVLIEQNTRSYNVYENRVIIGFLKTLVSEIDETIKNLSKRNYNKSKSVRQDGYIDSMYQIFSRSIEKINRYITELKNLQDEYHHLYYFYFTLFNISIEPVVIPPVFTPVFKSINAYRQIYIAIQSWFSIGNYDLGKDELLLSFISTSKIYEYYCLTKLLCYIEDNTQFKLTRSDNIKYPVKNSFYSNSKYDNTFHFEDDNIELTIFFQPVIYGDDNAINGIDLFRNTSSNSKTNNINRGNTYTPDYIIKAKCNDRAYYIILDAKFSTPDNIRLYQLQELVYKYLFSISTLNKDDNILGLYILCGKKLGKDTQDIIHDIAQKIGYSVAQFAEILVINGVNTGDYSIIAEVIRKVKDAILLDNPVIQREK